MTIKPYISRVGNTWVVLDKNSNEVYVTKDYVLARHYFIKRFCKS